MKKVSPQKKQPRISVKSNLLANVDLNQIDFTKDVLEHLKDILEKIENTFTLTPRTHLLEYRMVV